eukprot:Nk52_evm10s77 gene=Nk52_evmTU10s77
MLLNRLVGGSSAALFHRGGQGLLMAGGRCCGLRSTLGTGSYGRLQQLSPAEARFFHVAPVLGAKVKVSKLRAVRMLKDSETGKYEKGDIRVVSANSARGNAHVEVLPYDEARPYILEVKKEKESKGKSKKQRPVLGKNTLIKMMKKELEMGVVIEREKSDGKVELTRDDIRDYFATERFIVIQPSAFVMPAQPITVYGKYELKMFLATGAEPVPFTLVFQEPKKKVIEDYHARVAREAGVVNPFEEIDQPQPVEAQNDEAGDDLSEKREDDGADLLKLKGVAMFDATKGGKRKRIGARGPREGLKKKSTTAEGETPASGEEPKSSEEASLTEGASSTPKKEDS